MGRRLQQLKILLWKNWTLQKRKPCVTVFEILIPIVCFGILLGISSLYEGRSYYNPGTSAMSVDIPDDVDQYHGGDQPLILYAPNNQATSKIMTETLKKTRPLKVYPNISLPFQAKAFTNEEEFVSYYQNGNATNRVWAGLVFSGSFSSDETMPLQLSVKIRVRFFGKRTIYDKVMGSCPSSQNDIPELFLFLQYSIMASIIELHKPGVNITRDTNITLQTMPCRHVRYNPFLEVMFGSTVPLFIMFSFILSALQFTKSVVLEKQRKLKMWLQMLGVQVISQWGAWMISCLIHTTILAIIILIFSSISIHGHSILGRSDPSLFFVFLLCYSLSVVTFCFLVGSFFQKASHGAVACGVFFFISYLPYIPLEIRLLSEILSINLKMSSSLLFNVAMGLGCQIISMYELAEEGAQWRNFHRPPTVDNNFSLLLAMIMLLIDSAIYLGITWYVDSVFPGRHGVPRPWYFLFQKSYWANSSVYGGCSNLPDERVTNVDNVLFESEPSNRAVGIRIRRLRKVFGSVGKSKVAVQDMDLNVYKGQITALLGHNGAGKTTTLSMLSGFLPPTAGTATVNGIDLTENAPSVIQSIGLCPQDDILFDDLTVNEHLIFFSQLRDGGVRNVSDILEDVGLQDKVNTVATKLSGGQRRKLSVAIALLSNSETIILDEPTTGMDPQSRRTIWTLLQRYKENRAILFTTHSMDEADSLSDRVAIMSEGVIKCCGSPIFLKSRYGVGYHLDITKGPRCDVLSIKNVVQVHVPTACETLNSDNALGFNLPKESSSQFEKLFSELDARKESLGITAYCVSFTNMEDVFIGVEKTNHWKKSKPVLIGGDGEVFTDTASIVSSTVDLRGNAHLATLAKMFGFNDDVTFSDGTALYWEQFQATLVKKFILSLRNPFLLVVQILVTVVLTSLVLGLGNVVVPTDQSPLSLNIPVHWDNSVPYGHLPENNSTAVKLSENFVKTLQGTSSEAVTVDVGKLNMMRYLEDKLNHLGVGSYTRRFLIGGLFETKADLIRITGFFNAELYHTSMYLMASLMNSLFKYHVDNKAWVNMIYHPFPTKSYNDRTHVDSFYCIPIVFCLGLLSSTFVVLLLREKKSGAKHIQFISGLKPWIFWLANFVGDMLIFLIPIFALLIVFATCPVPFLNDSTVIGSMFLSFFFYGFSTIPFTYLFSFITQTPTCGFIMLLLICITFGLIPLIVYFIFGTFFGEILETLLSLLVPHLALGGCLMNIVGNYEAIMVCRAYVETDRCQPEDLRTYCCRGDELGTTYQDNYFTIEYPGAGRFILCMVFQGVLFFILVIVTENRQKRNRQIIPGETLIGQDIQRDQLYLSGEEEVLQEQSRIKANARGEADRVILQNVFRVFEKCAAVNKLNLGVPAEECFGLLGANGAGKTTTFKILTGEERQYNGDAFINGKSITSDLLSVYGTVGYCPQRDALIQQLTGREVLTLFAGIKGIQKARIRSVVDEMITLLFLVEHADTLVETYSFGNKRKLSTAIALIGNPPVLLLDEPTAGVDPVAKRRLWNIFSEVRASGQTVVLSSHSMEECDAVCTRLTIMVNGRFLCLGSPQELKHKYGEGYTLAARVGYVQEETSDRGGDTQTYALDSDVSWARIKNVASFIESMFPSHRKVHSSEGSVKYHLTDPQIPLSLIFKTMEEAKQQLNVVDYSVNQTSLEDVFLHMASSQLSPTTVC